jgi:hypothetical protein
LYNPNSTKHVWKQLQVFQVHSLWLPTCLDAKSTCFVEIQMQTQTSKLIQESLFATKIKEGNNHGVLESWGKRNLSLLLSIQYQV